ncbi:hypothetical protein Ancab_019265 [Ancistrocladus abbreviatus]
MGRKARGRKNESMNHCAATPRSQPEAQADAGGPISTYTSIALPESDKQLPSSKKKAKVTASIVRRSGRIQSTSWNQEIEHVNKEISISDSDKEDEVPLHNENGSLEESPDDSGRACSDGIPGAADVKYKRMYMNSQKKVQELEENIELRKKLENTIGKTRLFEENPVNSVIWTTISSMAEATERAVSLIAEAIHSTASFQRADDVEPEVEAARGKRAAAEPHPVGECS